MRALVCAADGCQRALRPNQPYTYREITAMEQVSRTGGVGKIASKKYTGRVFCADHGAGHPQADLFGGDA